MSNNGTAKAEEQQELNKILEGSSRLDQLSRNGISDVEESPHSTVVTGGKIEKKENFIQWTTPDNSSYFPASNTQKIIPPGIYEIDSHPSAGLYFKKITANITGLLRFPDTNSDKVVDEIQHFWQREDQFTRHNLPYKRGIILWGPPGSGKSSTIQLVISDVIERGGICINFTNPEIFKEGMRAFREIQPNHPVVVIMEDIDEILAQHSESTVLNLLDGVEEVHKIVFLASTNYPNKLGARIINRPSRFDKRFKIGFPSKVAREMYFKSLISDELAKSHDIDIQKWVKDTDKFSIAHLKELFVAVVILEDNYDEAITTLSGMSEKIKYENDFKSDKGMGFSVTGRG